MSSLFYAPQSGGYFKSVAGYERMVFTLVVSQVELFQICSRVPRVLDPLGSILDTGVVLLVYYKPFWPV